MAMDACREASAMHAMYEKKLALQAESYIQLKVAYEELSEVSTLYRPSLASDPLMGKCPSIEKSSLDKKLHLNKKL